MDKFNYGPLDLEKPAFRLVRLLRGDEGQLRCELFQASFEERESSISYEALSYTWGSMDLTESVETNGKRLDVTWNLWSALRDLRLPTQDRILWVDGLCIDQTNKKERGHQVRQMLNIYRQAETVIIWLGPATYATNVAIDSLRQLHESQKTNVPTLRQDADSDWTTRWADVKQVLKARYVDIEPRMREGLHELLFRPWFRRAWILQEIANAQSAYVYTGRKSVPARFFALGLELVGIRPNSHCEAVLAMMPGPGRHKYWWNENRHLYTLLTKFRESQSFHARDTIYALLGISSDACNNSALQADYEKPEEEIVRNTFRFLYFCDTNQCSKETPLTIRGLLDRLADLNNVALEMHIVNSDVRSMETILARSDFRVGGGVLACAVKKAHPEVFQVLLDRRRGEMDLTADTLRLAWQNPTHAAAMARMILKELPETFSLSTELLEANAQTTCQSTWIEILLEKWNTEEDIMKMMVSAASMTESTAISVMSELLSRVTSKVTEPVLSAAASNVKEGEALMRLFLQERGGEVKITEPVLSAAASNYEKGEALMRLSLQERGGEVKITEPVLLTAVMNAKKAVPLMKLFLQERGDEVKITEPVLLATARHYTEAGVLMKLFLQECGSKVKITESVLLAAAENELEGRDLTRLLLQEQGSEMKITEPLPLAIPQNRQKGNASVDLLLPDCESEDEITKLLSFTAVQNFQPGEVSTTGFVLKPEDAKNGRNSLTVANLQRMLIGRAE
jgi:hypothetical protein